MDSLMEQPHDMNSACAGQLHGEEIACHKTSAKERGTAPISLTRIALFDLLGGIFPHLQKVLSTASQVISMGVLPCHGSPL